MSNVVWTILIVGGFLIVAAAVIMIVVWLKGGADTGGKCFISILQGATDSGCKLFK